ncbi:hypothetical protein C8Q75DRAFT_716083 [Abortiporus biennis]|nr:hypothetical protein C8Q75DRAFT_716083 [Abortiporus biennis]
MNKSQYYLSQCSDAAAKSPMCFTLGAIMVKGGKVISTGYNHHRPHYEGGEANQYNHRKPISMHAEMHAIFNVTGMSPSFKLQGQANRDTTKSRRREGDRPRFSSRTSEDPQVVALAVDDGYAESNRTSPSSSSLADRCCASISTSVVRSGKSSWDARRRDSKVNGADIYVARFTKNGGMGNAKPCWRCLEWSRWAGIKRILYWNNEAGKFDVVKVNGANNGLYETQADIRLFSGLVRCRLPFLVLSWC